MLLHCSVFLADHRSKACIVPYHKYTKVCTHGPLALSGRLDHSYSSTPHLFFYCSTDLPCPTPCPQHYHPPFPSLRSPCTVYYAASHLPSHTYSNSFFASFLGRGGHSVHNHVYQQLPEPFFSPSPSPTLEVAAVDPFFTCRQLSFW